MRNATDTSAVYLSSRSGPSYLPEVTQKSDRSHFLILEPWAFSFIDRL